LKPDKDITRKENNGAISLMNTDAKSSTTTKKSSTNTCK
jgi:hypothetical protein